MIKTRRFCQIRQQTAVNLLSTRCKPQRTDNISGCDIIKNSAAEGRNEAQHETDLMILFPSPELQPRQTQNKWANKSDNLLQQLFTKLTSTITEITCIVLYHVLQFNAHSLFLSY